MTRTALRCLVVPALLASGCASLSAPPETETTLRFDSPAALDAWTIDGGEWKVEDARLVARSIDATGQGHAATATYRTTFATIQRVIVRGALDAASPHNFRVAVGPAACILNWELADANWFNYGRHETRTQPAALVPGRDAEVVFEQAGDRIRIVVDDRLLWETPGWLNGTVTLHPALGSTMRIREIVIRGRPVPGIQVKGPSASIL